MPIAKITQFVDGEEVTIFVEVEKVPVDDSSIYGDTRAIPIDKIIDNARDFFADGMQLVNNCAVRVTDTIKKIDDSIRPDEFEVQLAIKLGSEVGAVLVNAAAEAQLHVTMKWSNKDKK